MSEKLTLGTYPELPIDYPSTFNAIFDVGAGDLAHPHSGYIIDNTMSIIHSASTISQGDQKKIEAIKGWRVIGQNRLDENTPLTEGIIIYINKEDFEATPDSFIVSDDKTGSKTPYSSWVLADTYSTIWENQSVIVEAVDTEPFNLYTLSDDSQGYEMRIKFDPPLSRAPDKIIGIYKPNAMGEGPAPLYGKYEIITGQHRYRAMGNYGNSFGHNSMAQGPYSFAQGQQSVAYGHASHAEGRSSVAAGNFSHSEGESSAAIGTASHASGYQTRAIGYASQTAGFETVAEGDYSFAAGIGTIAKHQGSVVVGEYNTGECPNSCFEVGTGSRAARATGFYVSRNGLCYAPQTTIDNLEAQGDKALVTKEYVNTIAHLDMVDYIIETGTIEVETVPSTLAASIGDAFTSYDVSENITWQYEKYKSGKLILSSIVSVWNVSYKDWSTNLLETYPIYFNYPQEINNFIVDFRLQENTHGELRPKDIISDNVDILFSADAEDNSPIVFLRETGGRQSSWYYNEQGVWVMAFYRPNNLRENAKLKFVLKLEIQAYWKNKFYDSRYDYNQDGVIDAEDAQILANLLDGHTDITIPEGCVTDINNDGSTNNKDFGLLSQLIEE